MRPSNPSLCQAHGPEQPIYQESAERGQLPVPQAAAHGNPQPQEGVVLTAINQIVQRLFMPTPQTVQIMID